MWLTHLDALGIADLQGGHTSLFSPRARAVAGTVWAQTSSRKTHPPLDPLSGLALMPASLLWVAVQPRGAEPSPV